MNLYIPKLGDKITLASAWSFTLYSEDRNLGFIKTLVKAGLITEAEALIAFPTKRWNTTASTSLSDVGRGTNLPLRSITLPPNSTLTVDRIFIRKGASNFNSVTFVLKSTPARTWKQARFWVKLHEANQLQIQPHAEVATAHTALPLSLA